MTSFLRGASLAMAVACTLAYAADTQFWQMKNSSDYEKARLERLSLRSDGRISLAPEVAELFDASTSYLWALDVDSKGNVYTGGGNAGQSSTKLFVVPPAGKGRVLAELPGLQIQAIRVDAKDRVYAATSPDGKIYRIFADGKFDVFYDPKAKYIWAMAFDAKGDLYVGTGDRGEIFRVHPNGDGSVFFRAEDEHVRSLEIDKGGNIIAGTDPSGLVIRVEASTGKGFVLYQMSKREVTSLAMGKDGSIYALATGARAATAAPPPPPAPLAAPPLLTPPPASVAAAPRPVTLPTVVPAAPTGGSELVRIGSDGFPSKLWNSATEIAYAVALNGEGAPVIGTGNKGAIYRVDSELISTRLLTLAPTQVTALQATKKGMIAITGNIGVLYRIGPGLAASGVLESEALDAEWFSDWGRVTERTEKNGGSLAIETRSGNLDRPQKNWSNWAGVGERITSPPARYLQYRLTLKGAGGKSPELSETEIAYLPRNLPPKVEEIEIAPPNYRFPASLTTAPAARPAAVLALPAMAAATPSAPTTPPSSDPGAATLNFAKGYLSARWRAADPNGDALRYRVDIRPEGQQNWQLLKEEVTARHYSWDSTAFADGEYQLRVTASDVPSNSSGNQLENSLVSDTFIIDNTPPKLVSHRNTSWTVEDALNVIQRVEYSLNGGDWVLVEPKGRLSDSRRLDYELPKGSSTGKTSIAVRMADYFDNQSVERWTF